MGEFGVGAFAEEFGKVGLRVFFSVCVHVCSSIGSFLCVSICSAPL